MRSLFGTTGREGSSGVNQRAYWGSSSGFAGSEPVLQRIVPLDLPVKVRSWELTVYPRTHIRRGFRVTWVGASSNVNVLERRASQLAGRNRSAKSARSELCSLETTNVIAEPVTRR